MDNKFHDYSAINFKQIKYNQFIEKNPDSEEHNKCKNIEKMFNKEFIPCSKYKLPKDNLLLSHINLSYKGRNRIQVTTPVMRCLFGFESSFKNFQIKLSFDDIDSDPEIKNFYNFIKTCEYINMANIGLNVENDNDYISQIKQDSEEKYAPHLIIKLPFRYNKFDIDIYNKEYSAMSITDIRMSHMLKCNIYIDSIQKYNSRYICKWKCSYIEIIK